MNDQFIEFVTIGGDVILINKNHITCVEQLQDTLYISFLQAGERSVYAIETRLTLQQFRALL